MNSSSAIDKANNFQFKIEENYKSSNDRFMDFKKNLTQSPFGISNEANEKRKLTID